MWRSLALSLLAVIVPGRAFAVAHHEQVVVQKLRDPQTKKVNGFRIHAIVDPEVYDRFRLNVGKMTVDPSVLPQTHRGMPAWRHVGAGDQPGYVRATILDKANLAAKGAPAVPGQIVHPGMTSMHELQEVKLDVHYGVMNDLKPGDKVDIYTAFSRVGQPGYWHIYGMNDGPVTRNDAAHVHELPSETSTHGEATEVP